MFVEKFQDSHTGMSAAIHCRRFAFSAKVTGTNFCECCPIARVVDPDAHASECRQKDKFRQCFKCRGCDLPSCPPFYTTLRAYAKHHGTEDTEWEDQVDKILVCPECVGEMNGYMQKKSTIGDRVPGMKFAKDNGHVAMKVQRCVAFCFLVTKRQWCVQLVRVFIISW